MELPTEIWYKILLDTDFNTLFDLCNTNVQTNNICSDNLFWRDKFIYDSPSQYNLIFPYIKPDQDFYRLYLNVTDFLPNVKRMITNDPNSDIIRKYITDVQNLIKRDGPQIVWSPHRNEILPLDKFLLVKADDILQYSRYSFNYWNLTSKNIKKWFLMAYHIKPKNTFNTPYIVTGLYNIPYRIEAGVSYDNKVFPGLEETINTGGDEIHYDIPLSTYDDITNLTDIIILDLPEFMLL